MTKTVTAAKVGATLPRTIGAAVRACVELHVQADSIRDAYEKKVATLRTALEKLETLPTATELTRAAYPDWTGQKDKAGKALYARVAYLLKQTGLAKANPARQAAGAQNAGKRATGKGAPAKATRGKAGTADAAATPTPLDGLRNPSKASVAALASIIKGWPQEMQAELLALLDTDMIDADEE